MSALSGGTSSDHDTELCTTAGGGGTICCSCFQDLKAPTRDTHTQDAARWSPPPPTPGHQEQQDDHVIVLFRGPSQHGLGHSVEGAARVRVSRVACTRHAHTHVLPFTHESLPAATRRKYTRKASEHDDATAGLEAERSVCASVTLRQDPRTTRPKKQNKNML